jgi:phosphatidylglycerol:prolipoprotein diacylglycerol transferase
MLALAFGRAGCFLNGCCFGKPTNFFISVRFPYDSFSYRSQVQSDPARHRNKSYIELPADFFSYMPQQDQSYLKPFDRLTAQQKFDVTQGPFCALPVHPTEIYESLAALIGCILLYFHRKKGILLEKQGRKLPFFFRPGVTFALMFVIYGGFRFFIEFLRDDNPFQFDSLTVSQNLSIVLVFASLALIWLFAKMKPGKLSV